MSERREEFLNGLKVNQGKIDASNVFMAARLESERIEAEKNNKIFPPTDGNRVFAAMQSSSSTRRNLANAQIENEEARAALRQENKDLSSADAVFAAMETSGILRKKLEEAEKDVEESKRFIRGEGR